MPTAADHDAHPVAGVTIPLVTALDERGLEAGVRALRAGPLRNAYAVAVSGDTVDKLPL